MKRHSLLAGLALAVVAVLCLGGPGAASDQVPFSGSLDGSSDASAFPTVITSATGTASHLGKFSLTMPHTVFPATLTAKGTFELVAANGDTLVGTMTGVATPTATPNVLTIVETCTITDGTGRFDGASGSFTIERIYSRVTGVTSGSFTGTVSSPGSSD